MNGVMVSELDKQSINSEFDISGFVLQLSYAS